MQDLIFLSVVALHYSKPTGLTDLASSLSEIILRPLTSHSVLIMTMAIVSRQHLSKLLLVEEVLVGIFMKSPPKFYLPLNFIKGRLRNEL